MAKIRYKVDAKGVLSATADVNVMGRSHRVTAKAAATDHDKEADFMGWAHVTLELFDKKRNLQIGASKQETG